jgi:hypothetical protein
MDFDVRVKLAIYTHFAETGRRPSPGEVAARIAAAGGGEGGTGEGGEGGSGEGHVREAYARLRAQRVLVLESDGTSIRMAPPFSGVPTQHVVEADGVRYFANCAWDSLGIPAALHRPAVVHSRCEQTLEPFDLEVGLDGPEPSDWLFHCLVPAAKWWDDIVFT